jgi:hypothetical protein
MVEYINIIKLITSYSTPRNSLLSMYRKNYGQRWWWPRLCPCTWLTNSPLRGLGTARSRRREEKKNTSLPPLSLSLSLPYTDASLHVLSSHRWIDCSWVYTLYYLMRFYNQFSHVRFSDFVAFYMIALPNLSVCAGEPNPPTSPWVTLCVILKHIGISNYYFKGKMHWPLSECRGSW